MKFLLLTYRIVFLAIIILCGFGIVFSKILIEENLLAKIISTQTYPKAHFIKYEILEKYNDDFHLIARDCSATSPDGNLLNEADEEVATLERKILLGKEVLSPTEKCQKSQDIRSDISKLAKKLNLYGATIKMDGRTYISYGEVNFKQDKGSKYFASNTKIIHKMGKNIAITSFAGKIFEDIPKAKSIELILYEDITNIWSYKPFYEYYLAIIVCGFLTLIYVIGIVSSSYTQEVVIKQYEENLQLAQARKQAEEANEEKSKFLANISHELRTPLNAIIGFSEIMKDEVMGPINNPRYKEYVNDINISGIHLLSLINDILDFSKANAGKLSLDIQETDVTKLMKQSVRIVRPRADEAGVKLIERMPQDHCILKTDQKRLKQVLLNLFSNAVKFTPAGGFITLYAWKDVARNSLVIEVQDTGIGIEEKDISKVMATFGQIESNLSRKYEGTGLGLPLCNKLVQLMGGSMHIKSQIGEGTTVAVVLPYD